MNKIICPHCGWEIKNCIYIVLPTSCRFTLGGNGYIAKYYTEILHKERNLKSGLGFDCPKCLRRFPKSMTKDIKKALRMKLILNKLKK